MKKELFILVLVLTSASSFGQAVGTPYIFSAGKSPYVYQNIVTSYDGSSLTGWINGYGSDNQLTIDANVGNPSPSFYGLGNNIRAFRRDFGFDFKNKTVEFDIKISSGWFGFNIGTDVNGYSGISLELKGGGSTLSAGLNQSQNWFYPGVGTNSFAFNPSSWYAIKIVTEDGVAKWYVNNVYQGSYETIPLGLNQYFGVAAYNSTFHIDNIKITY
jgi:hypothetical protein